MQIKKERKQTYRYSYTQLVAIKPAKAPGQDSIGTGGQNSIGANTQGSKLGAALLQDAVNRAVAVSQNAGVRALLVHALHDQARLFYEHYGFQASPVHPLTLMLRLNTVKA
jgi:hypothetical protein